MKRLSIFATAVVSLNLAVAADVAEVRRYFDEENGVYVVDVPEGVSVAMEYDDTTAAGVYPIVKRGLGTVTAGKAMADFEGEIRIEAGVYEAKITSALGKATGGTVVMPEGALKFTCTTANQLMFTESITVCGTVINGGGVEQLNAFSGPVILGGNAKFEGASIGFLDNTLSMAGCKMTVKMNKSAVLKFADVEIVSGGDIEVLQGRLHLQGDAVWAGSEDNMLSIAKEAMLGMREATCSIPWTLDLDDGAILYPSKGDINNFGGNNWSGPVIVNGAVAVKYKMEETTNTVIRLDGPVSGTGAFVINSGAWLVLSSSDNAFTGGVDVSGSAGSSGGLVLAANGALPANGGKLTIRSGTVRLSSAERYDLPEVEVTSGGRIEGDHWGYGGTVVKLTKWGANILDFAAGLTVTGETHIGKSLMRVSESPTGTPGLIGVHKCFDTQGDWEAFCECSGEPSAAHLKNAFSKLISIGYEDQIQQTMFSPEAAYRSWTTDEQYLLAAYAGYIWNNDLTNKICTFASSIADTSILWVNNERLFKRTASSKDAGGNTHFLSLGECVLLPGPNSFKLLMGHRKSGSKGTRDDLRDDVGVYWAKDNGVMYREGAYGAPAVTNYLDFARLVDSGDGMLFTTTKDPSTARVDLNESLYRAHFDSLRFDRNAEKRCAIDLGGIDMFRQNGFVGCPRITNGTMCVTGVWSFAANDIARHPVEVACDAGIVFDDTKLSVSVAGYPRGEGGTVILRAEPGATVTGMPVLEAANPGIAVWEIKREIREGDICLVLYGRLRGTVISFR